MMFWQKFYDLCISTGSKPNPVGKQLGIASSTITQWKQGAIPSSESLAKIAAYFNVSTDYLLGQISESEELLRHTSDDNKKVFDKFIVALSQLNKNGQEIAYDYIDTLVKSGKYSPDSENDTIGIAAKGNITSTTVNTTEADADLDELASRKGF